MKLDTIKKRSLLVVSVLILLWAVISIWLFSQPKENQSWLITPIQKYISIPEWAILISIALVGLLFIIIATGAIFIISSYIKTGSFKHSN